MRYADSLRYSVILSFLFAACALVAQEASVALNASSSNMFLRDAGEQKSASSGNTAVSNGRLEIKGINGNDEVYLNGKAPEFKVGTVKDTQTRNLLLPPGQQHVILVDPNSGKQIYSGYVVIKPGQKATLHVDKSDSYYEKWAGAPGMPLMGPYTTDASIDGGYSGVVPVNYKVTAPKLVPCGEKAELRLSGPPGYALLKDMDNHAISKPLDPNGLVTFDPGLQGSTFRVEWVSRWGVYLSDPQTIDVDQHPHVTLAASPGSETPYVYHTVGERVVEDPTVNLHWTVKNATLVQMINPQGESIKVPITGAYGNVPVKFVLGDYDAEKRAINYRIQATNPCTATTEIATVRWDPTHDPEVVAQAPLPPVLPPTGSPLPLIGLLGLGSLLSGLALRMFRK